MPGAFWSIFHVGTPLILRTALQGKHNLISLEVSQFLFTISRHWSYKIYFWGWYTPLCCRFLEIVIGKEPRPFISVLSTPAFALQSSCDGEWRIHRARSVHYLATEEGRSTLDCAVCGGIQQLLLLPFQLSGRSAPRVFLQSPRVLTLYSGGCRLQTLAENESVRRWVVSTSLWPHELQPARLFCPWNCPGKNTGVDSHSLLQEIFATQGLNLGLTLHAESLQPEPLGYPDWRGSDCCSATLGAWANALCWSRVPVAAAPVLLGCCCLAHCLPSSLLY